MWFPGGSLRRNYPNFSHGTSGVSYFLATLYQETRQREFLDAALPRAPGNPRRGGPIARTVST